MNETANNLFFFIPLHLRFGGTEVCVVPIWFNLEMASHTLRSKKKRQTTANEHNVYSLPPAVHKHDFTSFLLPEFICTLNKFMKVPTPFFVSLVTCIIYSWHTVYMIHLHMNNLCPRSDFYTPACCFFYIKLRDSTGQVKVHKIKE